LIENLDLVQLSLRNSALSKRPGYRQAMIKKFPDITILDGKVKKKLFF
jgi:hypothetical protein